MGNGVESKMIFGQTNRLRRLCILAADEHLITDDSDAYRAVV